LLEIGHFNFAITLRAKRVASPPPRCYTVRAMPRNFAWLVQDQLAGMERPGSFHPLGEDLRFLKERGIGLIISLTVAPLDRNECERFGFELFHIPIRDGEAPEISEIERFLSYVAYGLGGAKKVVAHCGAGYGRTGTMLACFLVRAGRRAEEAIAEVRRRIPGAVENEAQERRVEEYALHLERKGRTTAREGA